VHTLHGDLSYHWLGGAPPLKTLRRMFAVLRLFCPMEALNNDSKTAQLYLKVIDV